MVWTDTPHAQGIVTTAGVPVATGTGWKTLTLGSLTYRNPTADYAIHANGKGITVAKAGFYHVSAIGEIAQGHAGQWTFLVATTLDDWTGGVGLTVSGDISAAVSARGCVSGSLLLSAGFTYYLNGYTNVNVNASCAHFSIHRI